jgi:transketolase
VESTVAWKKAVERTNGPTSLIFSGQYLPHQNRTAEQLANAEKGGYTLYDCAGTPEAIIIATGSEIEFAVAAAQQLNGHGKKVRVVSMPSADTFDSQEQAYRDSVLPPQIIKRVAVEAGITNFWLKYVGLRGRVVGINHFGESAPAGILFKEFGFTTENIVKTVESLL